MPPRRRQAQEEPPSYTLGEAIIYLNSTQNAKKSKDLWSDNLATLVYYNEMGQNAYPVTLRKKEMIEKYQDVNLVPLLNDVDTVVDIVNNQIKSSRDGNPIAVDTRKQYYTAILRATQKGSPFRPTTDIKKQYEDKLKEAESISNKQRNQNAPTRALKEYPDFTWIKAHREYKEFLNTHAFTNTEKGRHDLRCAVVVGLYVLQRPRRVEDYSSLQYYSKKPADRELANRNVIYAEDGKLFFSIDKFKTRFRVSGASKKKTELLPRYVKQVNPKLAELFKTYIKKHDIKDMSKLTAEEKRQNKQYFVFYKSTKTRGSSAEALDSGAFGKHINACCKEVFKGRTKLTANSFRHIYNTWLVDNIRHFTDEQLKQFSIDVGDTPRELPTNYRYRIANQANVGMEKTQIEDGLREVEEGEEGDSARPRGMSTDELYELLLTEQTQEVDPDAPVEVKIEDEGDEYTPPPPPTAQDTTQEAPQAQPAPQQAPRDGLPVPFGEDMTTEELHTLLGQYVMAVEEIKSVLARRLGFRTV